MLVTADGVKPDPDKVAALNHLKFPEYIGELNSFLYMMQSDEEFIKNFARLTAPLRELLFKRTQSHSDCLMRY